MRMQLCRGSRENVPRRTPEGRRLLVAVRSTKASTSASAASDNMSNACLDIDEQDRKARRGALRDKEVVGVAGIATRRVVGVARRTAWTAEARWGIR